VVQKTVGQLGLARHGPTRLTTGGLIRMTIEEQLRFEPDKETRNRKPLQRPVAFEATWELRLGPENRFRVFYAVSHERHEVQILAIGTKQRNRLRIAREEIKL